jgi:hypothetical protein
MSARALKNGGPAREPTFPSSNVPRANMTVTGAQTPFTRSFRVTSQLSLATRSAAEEEVKEGVGRAEALRPRMAERKSDLSILREREREREIVRLGVKIGSC